jgi:alpha-ribazole phosphatase
VSDRGGNGFKQGPRNRLCRAAGAGLRDAALLCAVQACTAGLEPRHTAPSGGRALHAVSDRGGLWLVRHAQPLIAPGICYGQLDVPADVEATAACARTLAEALPHGIPIICSPLQRCEQLAHVLLGLRADLTYKIDPRLQEMDFGQWEGQRWDDIGAAALDAWVADFPHHRPGGGESVQSFMHRVAAAWDEARGPSGAVWITHAGVIRAATLLQQGQRQIDQAAHWPAVAPGFGSWIQLSTP